MVVDADFERALRLGLGRAIVRLRVAGGGPWCREAVLWACRHDLAYDRQIERGREVYLADLIAATGEPEFYRRWLLRATEPWRLRGEGGEQLVALLRVFAARGDGAARARLYEIFAANAAGERPDGAAEIVALDGLAGLLVVAPHLRVDPDEPWFAGHLINKAGERDGEAATWAALDALAARDAAVARLLALVRADEERKRAWREGEQAVDWPTDYPTIRAQLRAGESRAVSALHRWAREATDAELVPLANDLLAEAEPTLRTRYLRIFFRRRFPLDHAPLLAWARDQSPRIAHAALHALAQIEADDVRALGLALLAEGNGGGGRLLAANYRTGDFALIERLLLAWTDRDEIHDLGIGLQDLTEAHPVAEARGALLALYECGPCLYCRHHAVRLLLDLGPLPAWLVEECRWDADPAIRELVGAGAIGTAPATDGVWESPAPRGAAGGYADGER